MENKEPLNSANWFNAHVKKREILICIISALVLAGVFFLINTLLRHGANVEEVLISTSTSPQGTYFLEVYRTEPGATVDFSLKVYMTESNDRVIIYNKYHESDAEITWMSDDTVRINSIELNLADGETFDWRN